MREIYLDNNATTEISDKVLERQYEILKNNFGNASSKYILGERSKKIIEDSREIMKKAINAGKNDTLIFTGCASESNSSVFFSAINAFPEKKHIVVSAVEHLSVLSTAMFWKEKGFEVTVLGVDNDGNLNIEEFRNSVRKDTLLISIMTANNETGVIFPIKQLVQIAKEIAPDVLFHTDAVQAIGKIPVDVGDTGVDYMSVSGHKFHAPKGVGALYVRADRPFIPLLCGGHQEGNLRAGTENIASIGAMGCAASDIGQLIAENKKREKLREWMEEEIGKIGDVMIIGQNAKRLPNTSNIAIKDIPGSELLFHLAGKGIYVSTGSACNSVSVDPSHVLTAMAVPIEYQHSIRVSLSSFTTGDEIDIFVNTLKEIVSKLRRR